MLLWLDKGKVTVTRYFGHGFPQSWGLELGVLA